jgi:hypothetical protein
VAGKWEQDHELITFSLTRLDRFFVWFSVIGTLVLIAFFAAMTTFEGVWIGGMPKSAFYILVIGIIDAVVGVGGYFAYKAYYDRLLEQGK